MFVRFSTMKLLFSPACTLHFLERSHHEEPILKSECLYSTSWEEASIFLGIIFLGFPDSSLGKEFTCNAGDSGSIPGSGRSTGEGIGYPLQYSWGSLVTQLVKNPPAMQETWIWSLGWEDLLEKGKATHSSILAWRIPPHGHRVGHDWVTFTCTVYFSL